MAEVDAFGSPNALLHYFTHNVQLFRGGLVFKARRLWVSLNSRLESNKEEKREKAAPGSIRTGHTRHELGTNKAAKAGFRT